MSKTERKKQDGREAFWNGGGEMNKAKRTVKNIKDEMYKVTDKSKQVEPSNNFTIPDKPLYSREEVKDIMWHQTQTSLDSHRGLAEFILKASALASRIDRAKGAIFTLLMSTDSPTWPVTLKALWDNYNSAVTSARADIKKLAKDELGDPSAFMVIEQTILSSASQLGDAITDAIATENATSLRGLSQEFPDIMDMLQDHLDAFSTDDVAKDSRIKRYKVYIGLRCNYLEGKGVEHIRQMWQTIYRDLKAKKGYLRGDALVAWAYLEKKNPFGKTEIQLRDFEKEISKFKQLAARLNG